MSDIMERIYRGNVKFHSEHGYPPKYVYIGLAERVSLKECISRIKMHTHHLAIERSRVEVYGMEVLDVDKDHHLGFGV